MTACVYVMCRYRARRSAQLRMAERCSSAMVRLMTSRFRFSNHRSSMRCSAALIGRCSPCCFVSTAWYGVTSRRGAGRTSPPGTGGLAATRRLDAAELGRVARAACSLTCAMASCGTAGVALRALGAAAAEPGRELGVVEAGRVAGRPGVGERAESTDTDLAVYAPPVAVEAVMGRTGDGEPPRSRSLRAESGPPTTSGVQRRVRSPPSL